MVEARSSFKTVHVKHSQPVGTLLTAAMFVFVSLLVSDSLGLFVLPKLPCKIDPSKPLSASVEYTAPTINNQ